MLLPSILSCEKRMRKPYKGLPGLASLLLADRVPRRAGWPAAGRQGVSTLLFVHVNLSNVSAYNHFRIIPLTLHGFRLLM
jgi:hypothetical protein